MIIEAVSVKPLPNYQLQVGFNTGEEKVIDFMPYLNQSAWERLRNNPVLFASARAEGFAVIWNDEIDIAAEALYDA